MKHSRIFIIALLLMPVAMACHSVDDYERNPVGNFDALWSIMDEHYCFFDEKGVDWDSVYREYRPRVNGGTNSIELFQICSEMLNELHDGHVNLIGWYSVSYYKKWWSDYPQNYDQRLVDEHYLHFNGLQRNGLTYYMLRDSVAYMRYPTFAVSPGDGTLDWALAILSKCPGLIIDIRDNGGGDLTNVELFVRRFIKERTLAGYICHKTGKGHNDFSKPYPIYYEPAEKVHIKWHKPIVVLVNRSTYSAANNFVAVMRNLEGVTIVGDVTGGGSGLPFSSETPYGWTVRFSSSPMYDANMQSTESGIAPDIRIDLDPEQALQGVDTMLEVAINTILSQI